MVVAALAFLQTPPSPTLAQTVEFDGLMDEWSAATVRARDPLGDVAAGQVDLAELRLMHDGAALYVMVDLTRETVLQDPEQADVASDLVLFMDLDDSAATGRLIDGVGVDLEVRLGAREFVRYQPAPLVEPINRLGLMSLPTHSATEFEIRIPFATAPEATDPGVLFNPGTVRVFAAELMGGDRLPDAGSVACTIRAVEPEPPDPISLQREDPGHLRVYSHNVEHTSIVGNPAPFRRILRALRPDVICYQEAYERDIAIEDAIAFAESALPSPPGGQWFGARVGDNVTLSRFPISQVAAVDGNLVCLLDLPAALSGHDLVLFNVHTPCCGRNAGRDREHDHISATWRDLMAGTGPFPIGPESPVMMLGDFNMVGYRRQLETLRDGRFIDPATWGHDFAPAREAGSLRAVPLRHTHTRFHYTWRSDGGSFAPGRLDWFLYSPDRLALHRNFVLWTPDMPATVLAAAGLHRDDSLASDHLALVADFTFSSSQSLPAR